MSRLSNDARLPNGNDLQGWRQRLYELVRDIVNQVNGLSEGRISACTNAAPAMPVTGVYAPGDFVRNTAPAEAGPVGSKYVVEGWLCTAAPTNFVQKRFLTGN
jgi:hypothetical protein